MYIHGALIYFSHSVLIERWQRGRLAGSQNCHATWPAPHLRTNLATNQTDSQPVSQPVSSCPLLAPHHTTITNSKPPSYPPRTPNSSAAQSAHGVTMMNDHWSEALATYNKVTRFGWLLWQELEPNQTEPNRMEQECPGATTHLAPLRPVPRDGPEMGLWLT